MGVWEGAVNELHLFAGAGGGILPCFPIWDDITLDKSRHHAIVAV
jgi:hypothetical protein